MAPGELTPAIVIPRVEAPPGMIANPPQTDSPRKPTPTPQTADSSAEPDHRFLDLLEKDLDEAVEQPPERRRIQFSKEIVENPKVRHFIKYYSTSAKSHFKEVLTRSGKYMPMIAKVLNEEGLPPELGYLALIESEFVVNTTSPNGAVGLWQFIAPTAKKYGLRIDQWVDERRDPVKSTRAAAAYLKYLHDYYGRWFLATAAYNAGPGNIDKALRQSNAKDFWSIKAKASLSDETRDFVPKFIAVSLIATNPHKYGFHEVRYVPPMDYEEVEVRRSMSLSTLAGLAETPLSEIRRLNPALLRNVTPPWESSYRIKLPGDKAAVLLAKMNEELPADEPENHRIVTHKVKRGETLFSIARFYGLNVRTLMNFNGLTTSRLRIGQKLMILLEGLRRTLD
ncbi:MAG: transglycosylase SLT domain-containing protein [Chloroflexota bacterium]